MPNTYWIASSKDRNSITVHLVDDIDCLPPDVLSPVRRIPTIGGKRLAAETLLNIARLLRNHGDSKVYVSANLSDGIFETFKTVDHWGKS